MIRKRSAVALALAIAIGLLAPGCQCGRPTPTPTTSPGVPDVPLTVNATIGKAAYLPGEPIRIQFTFKNRTPSALQAVPFPPLVEIARPRADQPTRSFPAGSAARSLAPGETANLTITWDQLDSQQRQVTYGYYYIQLGDIRAGDAYLRPSFGLSAPVLILPVEGVLEQTIKVNNSLTVAGTTVVLQEVALSARGMVVLAFNTPANYQLSQGPALPPPSLMVHAEAQYSIDRGALIDAGPSGLRFLSNGVRHVWDNLDPVPRTAKELTFIVTRIGDKTGPWEFRVPLQ